MINYSDKLLDIINPNDFYSHDKLPMKTIYQNKDLHKKNKINKLKKKEK